MEEGETEEEEDRLLLLGDLDLPLCPLLRDLLLYLLLEDLDLLLHLVLGDLLLYLLLRDVDLLLYLLHGDLEINFVLNYSGPLSTCRIKRLL